MRLLARGLVPLAFVLLARSPAAQHAQRVPPPRMRVLVPAYFYPVPGSPWERLTPAAARHPGLVWAIGNPNSGPGATLDTTYRATFQAFRQAGGRLIGYVATGYGTRPLVDVQAEMAQWFTWYSPDGIFLDEMDSVPGAHEAYYRALYAWMETFHPGQRVVGNPGTSTTLDYVDGAFGRCADTVCLFEDSTSFLAWTPDPWTAGRPRREVYVLPHTVGAAAWPAVLAHAHANRVGWIYTTDDDLPNPWDTLPPWFEDFVAAVDALR